MWNQQIDLSALDFRQMLAFARLPPLMEGRKAQLLLPAGCSKIQHAVYTYSDGRLCGPIDTGDVVENGNSFWTATFSNAPDAAVFVVNKGVLPLPEQVVPYALPVSYPDGSVGSMQLRFTVRARVRCTDTRALAKAYLDGEVGPAYPAEQCAADQIGRCLRTRLLHHGRALAAGALQESPQAARLILEETAQAMAQELQYCTETLWLAVHHCEVSVELLNEADVEQRMNREWEWQRQMSSQMVEAAIQTAFANPNAEVTQLAIAYCQANPGADFRDVVQFSQQLKQILTQCTAQQLLERAKAHGLLTL